MSKLESPVHFKTKWTDQKYTLTQMGDTEEKCWNCHYYGTKPQHYNASYTAHQIEQNFSSGDWERFYENEEDRPLKFPFVVEHWFSKDIYEIQDGSQKEMVTVVCKCGKSYCKGRFENQYSYEHAKSFIKDGEWRVVSVGHDVERDTPVVGTSYGTHVWKGVGEQESLQKPSEAPTSDRDKGEPLVIKVEAKDAVKAAKELVNVFAELEDVVMRVESRMKRIFGGK